MKRWPRGVNGFSWQSSEAMRAPDGVPVHYERQRPDQSSPYRLVPHDAGVRMKAQDRKRLEQLCR